MKKLTLSGLMLLLALGLVACQAESEPAVAVIPTVAEAEPAGESVAEATEASAAPRPVATDLPVPDEAVPVEPTTAIAEAAPTEIPTEESVEPVVETGFGMVEGTFYRGLSTAPVRLIDYSDFL